MLLLKYLLWYFPICRLRRNWPHFRRSAPRGSSTCWNVRTEKWTPLTQKVEVSASEAWDLWTSPKKTTDESGLISGGEHIHAPFSRPPPRLSRPPRWRSWITFSYCFFFSRRYCIFESRCLVQWELLLWNLKGESKTKEATTTTTTTICQ